MRIGYHFLKPSLLVIFLIFSLVGIGQKTTKVISEDQALRELRRIPEVVKYDKSIRLKSGGKQGIAFLVDHRPDEKNDSTYLITAGRNGKDRFQTLLIFLIGSQPTVSIKVLDTKTDKFISLNSWRKKNQ